LFGVVRAFVMIMTMAIVVMLLALFAAMALLGCAVFGVASGAAVVAPEGVGVERLGW
jgi:hypothetical protein